MHGPINIMYSDFAVNKYLHTVAYGRIFINIAMLTLHINKWLVSITEGAYVYCEVQTETSTYISG